MIDIFAGPGGLSEGFSRYADWFGDEEIRFRSVLSIEKDETAVRTLTLRAFYRQFDGDLPPEYWAVVKGQASVSVLEDFPEWRTAQRHVWQAELGVVPNDELHSRIELRLKGADEWLLIGGPPCQAYSLMGRARMTGIGFEGRSDAEAAEETRKKRLASFHKDVRHVLYREYLRIIAVHQPTAFVMENVRGILSAKLPGPDGAMQPVFDRIRSDLEDPWASLADDEDLEELRSLARPGSPKYRLHALSAEHAGLWLNEPSNADFLLKSEDFGVPQRRHRVIVVGIREDHLSTPAPLRRARPSTVRDAIGQMPVIRSGLSAGKDSDAEWSARRAGAALPLLNAPLADEAIAEGAVPDLSEFKNLMAQALLYRRAEKLIRPAFQGFQANITAYTISVIANRLGDRISLSQIWQQQAISDAFVSLIIQWSREVNDALRSSAGQRIVSEWAKKEECWEYVQSREFSEPAVRLPEMQY